jgi:uncharacterized membrane protein
MHGDLLPPPTMRKAVSVYSVSERGVRHKLPANFTAWVISR